MTLTTEPIITHEILRCITPTPHGFEHELNGVPTHRLNFSLSNVLPFTDETLKVIRSLIVTGCSNSTGVYVTGAFVVVTGDGSA